MLAVGVRIRRVTWAVGGILLAAFLTVGIVLAFGPPEPEGDVDLRSLPRFGELVRKVDRAVRQRPAEGASEGAASSEPAPAPSPPAVNRSAFPVEPEPEAEAEWRAAGTKTILQLQRYRSVDTVRVENAAGGPVDIVLTDLSPRHGISYLAELGPAVPEGASSGPKAGPWHLHNADPARQLLRATADGLLLVTEQGEEECRLWPGGDPALLESAARRGRELGSAWMPLCGEAARLFLRLPVSGRKTHKEWTADLLRDNLPAGEQLTVLVRKTLFADSELRVGGVLERRATRAVRLPGAPPRVAIDPSWSDLPITLGDLGLSLAESAAGHVPVGRWQPLADRRRGVWVSVFQPRLVDDRVVKDPRLQPLDEVELSSMVYLVALDLADHELSFVLGTDHPRLAWSERVPREVGDRKTPGPDGFADGAPLVRSGQVPPWRLGELQATFTGGFKRSHGAFKSGDLSRRHAGSHYGFVEDGVVWSKPVPGLATVTVWDDGRVDLHTWTEADEDRLARVRHLRQNGVPLLAPETAEDGTESIRAGSLVGRWGEGNWSGSQDRKLRSVRAGLCLTEVPREGSTEETDRHLIYGWFSAGTPSGMAKVFLAYRCRYALLLDMNALEHTYLSILTPTTAERPIPASALRVEHLVRGMAVLDETRGSVAQGGVTKGSVTLPRFAGFADNRDFFYLTRKTEPAP